MKRMYEEIIAHHLEHYTEMLFLVGPRQVGKTTSSLFVGERKDHLHYYNWDDDEDKLKIQAGASTIAQEVGLSPVQKRRPIIVFDEIHKYTRWKHFLKGFYDKYGRFALIIATGSARLDVYRKGGDSLMGRYFPFHMHPLTTAEILHHSTPKELIRNRPAEIQQSDWEKLFTYGGFPKPFLTGDAQFYNRWKRLRQQLLFKEDIRDLTQVQELAQMELLAEHIRHNATHLLSYASLSKMVRASADTIRRWTKILRSMFFHYEIRPWSKNVTRSLIKEPKYYLWDWATIEDPGARLENLVASHLLKAVHYWTDAGFGEFGLYFIRDKEKREVDFLVSRDQKPWFLVEVKSSASESLSPHLHRFQAMTKAEHAFQIAANMDFLDINCFDYREPVVVPAKTFLSQLV